MTHARADWASLLNGVLLAYRVTPQQATGFSSFELLYAHAPVLVGEQLSGEDLDPLPDSDIQRVPSNSGAVGRAATRLAERAEVLRSHRAVAMHNQKVAQTRDQEQYRRRRDGHYVLPRRGSGIRRGDAVYLKNDRLALEGESAMPTILRVVAVTDNGIVWLRGSCGGMPVGRNMNQVAPCGLQLEPEPERIPFELPVFGCCRCGLLAPDVRGDPIVLCHSCPQVAHVRCVSGDLPSGRVDGQAWFCPGCRRPDGESESEFRMDPELVSGDIGSALDMTSKERWVGQRVALPRREGGPWRVAQIRDVVTAPGRHAWRFTLQLYEGGSFVLPMARTVAGLKAYREAYCRREGSRPMRNARYRSRTVDEAVAPEPPPRAPQARRGRGAREHVGRAVPRRLVGRTALPEQPAG